ncbi:MAG: hypothetical protein ABEL76_08855 [Bradymonadaceae bacterium]
MNTPDDDTSADQPSADTAPGDTPSDRAGATGPRAQLSDSLTRVKNTLQDRVRDQMRSKKALEQLCRTGALENLDLVRKYTDWLRDANLEAVELEEERQHAVDSLDTYVEHRRRKRRMRFMRELDRAAGEHDLSLEKRSDTPLVLAAAPFVVEADFESGRAELRYARETLEDVPLDPEALFGAWTRNRRRLEARSVDSPVFFEWLERAYDLAIAARDSSPGDRVDLVDLLAPLALLASDADQWRDPSTEELDAYPRFLLAHQLRQLRRDGLLERDGRRVDLGTATGGSTENKEDVVFLPTAPGEGQYYLSIRMTD